MLFPSIDELTALEFERTVKRWFESVAETLDEFEAHHLEPIKGMDGEFAFDVSLRFTAFGGAKMLCVCECKKHKNPIKREVVQTLYAKLRSVGAQKRIVVSTASFQAGAKEFAIKHGIALVQIVNGSAAYIVASAKPLTIPDHADPYCGLIESDDVQGTFSLVTADNTYLLESFLKSPECHPKMKNDL